MDASVPEKLELGVEDIPGVTVHWNALYDSTEPQYVDEDLVYITLPGGIAIDVGWYGDMFAVQVIRDEDWEDPSGYAETQTPREVAEIVRRLVAKYMGHAEGEVPGDRG